MSMSWREYARCDALELAALVRDGAVATTEVVAAATQRLDAVNPRLNAVVRRIPGTAATARGPMAGVPFLVKDIVQDVAGVPTTRGSRAFSGDVPVRDSGFVRRARDSGLVLLGKTNLSELGLKAVTESALFGPCRNPWDPRRTPGGSSGGAAAAVAAGIVPVAGANDGGGSIRIPAGYCGVFGLRPSRGRVSAGPAIHELWHGAGSDHVISRSVRDSAAMLDVLHGNEPGDPFRIAPPARPYLQECGIPPGRLRIAHSCRSPIGQPVHPEAIRAVEGTASLLEDLGHTVEMAEPEVDGLGLAHCYLHLYFGQVAAAVRGRPASALEPDTRVLAMLGRAIDSGTYVASHDRWNEFSRALGAFFRHYDLYLTPVAAEPPALIGELDTPLLQRLAIRPLLWLDAGRLLLRSGIVERLALRSLQRTPFTQLANLTGVPAMSVPLHWTPEGLPMGSQFMAPVGCEDRLLRLAAQLEQARPWRHRLPVTPPGSGWGQPRDRLVQDTVAPTAGEGYGQCGCRCVDTLLPRR